MKKILITGGAGFIGSNLALHLIKRGYDITVLDNLSPQIHGSDPISTSPLYGSIVDKVKFIEGTVTSTSDWEKSLIGQDAIIHLAAETGTGQSMYEIAQYVNVNIGGTAKLLNILANNNHTIKKIIVASSRAIYGEGKYKCAIHGIVYPSLRKDESLKAGDFECKCPVCESEVEILPTSEDSLIHPTSVYGITKQNQEQLILSVSKSIGIPAIAFRYQNVYGPGQALSNPYTGILSIFSTRIKNRKEINIFEDGKESRDFVYIDDVIRATTLGLERHLPGSEVFNVGTGVLTDVVTVAQKLKKNFNSDIKIKVSQSYRLGDIRHNFADLSKIRAMLGFSPSYNFEDGIKLFCEWVEKQETKPDRYEESLEELRNRGLFK